MTFQNLLKIGQLKAHTATVGDVQKMLAAVRRNLKDAGLAGNSGETRFDCAYKAIMQCALIAMWANGYRPSTNVVGVGRPPTAAYKETKAQWPATGVGGVHSTV